MSVRLRLALWSAAIAATVLLLVSGTAYALHVRSQYDDLDGSLALTAEHLQEELRSLGATPNVGGSASGNPNIIVQLYDADLSPLDGASDSIPPPPLTPLEVLAQDAGPAYDQLLRWLPGGATVESGAFATTRDQATGVRLRAYALPVGSDTPSGYVLTWASLEQLDESRAFLRLMLIGVILGGTVAAAGGSFVVAGQALRPVATMTQTARAIAASRGFARRLEEPARKDELGRLAHTFNEMLASLEEAYRLQQRFVADAAHELRAPLTAIMGNLDLLTRMPDMLAEERAEALAYADAEARRLSRIVAELLTLARADAGQTLERRPVELDRVLLDALSEVRLLAEGRRLELVRFEPAVVEGDPDRLKQLVLNLLDNALKYTPRDGGITIEMDCSTDEAILVVRDTGIGISSEDLPHVFERFYRADLARSRDPGSTGLGLAIVKWIVQQHEGDISIESAVGSGTAVIVRLPLSEAADPRTARQKHLDRQAP
jgi:signal transduction histidine kinase